MARDDTESRIKYTVSIQTSNLGGVQINPEDIKELYFMEDIHNFCITGKLVFDDMYNIFDEGPFTGLEQIIVYWGKDSKIAFEIYKVGKIQQVSSAQTVAENRITLFLVDLTFSYWTQRKFNKSWGTEENPKYIGSIVDDILSNFINNPEHAVYESPNGDSKLHFIMTFWTPLQALKYLNKRAVGSETGKSGYLLYNSIDKNHVRVNWCTLEKLLRVTEYEKLEYAFEKDRSVKDDVHDMRNIILDWKIQGLDRFALKKLAGTTMMGFNFNEKNIIHKEVKHSDILKDLTILGTKTLHKDFSDERVWYNATGESNEKIMENMFYTDFVNNYPNQLLLHAVVEGTQDPERYLGMHINLKWPGRSDSSTQNLSGLLKGRWMIKGITHMFVNNSSDYIYKQKLSLIKLGYDSIKHAGIKNAGRSNIIGDGSKK